MGVAKLLPEESLSRGLWVKSNTLPHPEHRLGSPLGVLLNPICQHPSRSDECALPSCLSWDTGHTKRVTQEESGRMEKEGSGKSFKIYYSIFGKQLNPLSAFLVSLLLQIFCLFYG